MWTCTNLKCANTAIALLFYINNDSTDILITNLNVIKEFFFFFSYGSDSGIATQTKTSGFLPKPNPIHFPNDTSGYICKFGVGLGTRYPLDLIIHVHNFVYLLEGTCYTY